MPQLVSRRVLELLAYLCRHQAQVPGALVLLRAPSLRSVALASAARHDRKGEGAELAGELEGVGSVCVCREECRERWRELEGCRRRVARGCEYVQVQARR